MWRRGANLAGDTANFIETEQLLEVEGFRSSLLQVSLLYLVEVQKLLFVCFYILSYSSTFIDQVPSLELIQVSSCIFIKNMESTNVLYSRLEVQFHFFGSRLLISAINHDLGL